MISLCMIVRDEAEHLPACLASVAGLVDEIVVVDTGSSDDTAEIAARAGALVIFEPWADDFAAARNVGLAAASGDWILVLDADEQLAPESIPVITSLTQGPPFGYDVRIRNLCDAQGALNALEHFACRLFPRADHLRFAGLIHENIVSLDLAHPLPHLPVPEVMILHAGYTPAIVAARGKPVRNLLLLRKALNLDPENPFHHYNLGLVLRTLEQDEEARVAFEEVLTLCGDWVPAYLDSAYVQLQSLAMKAKDPDAAWHWTKQGARVCRANPDYWINRGTLAVNRGRISEGIEAYTEAWELGRQGLQISVVQHSSYTWKPFVLIANAFAFAGDVETAALFYEACRELYPELDLQAYSDPERTSDD